MRNTLACAAMALTLASLEAGERRSIATIAIGGTVQPMEGRHQTHAQMLYARDHGIPSQLQAMDRQKAALLKRPMVITYRMSPLSWQILRHMNYLPYVGLPNVLAGRLVVPELLQQNATPEKIAETLLQLVYDKAVLAEIKREFSGIHTRLRQNTGEKAAQCILGLLK